MHVHDNIPYYLTMSSILLNNNNILVTTYLSTKYPYLSLYSILMCFCWGEHPFKCKVRDQWIGWLSFLKVKRLAFIANNSRFLILPSIHIPNLGSPFSQ